VARKKLIVAGGLVLAALVGLGFYWPFGKKDEVLRLPGVVEVREVRLGSKLGGRVAKTYVEEGDEVRAGKLLVRLEAPELTAQLEQWEARLESAEAALKKAESGPRRQEKDAAAAALGAAKAKLARLEAGDREEDKRYARAELIQAQEDFDRVEKAYRREAASRSEYDAARTALDRCRARDARAQRGRAEEITEAREEVKRLQAEADLLQEGTRFEDILQSRATVAETRAKVRELKAQLAEAEVRTPNNPRWKAVVEVLAVRPGDLVAPNQPLVRVLESRDQWVKVYVPETELGKVRKGQKVEVTVDSHGSKRFKGTVIHVASESEFTPRNVQSVDERRNQVFGVKVRVDDPDGVFKPGMAAEVLIPVAK
jgi:multidrug resistance efflux pump